MTYALLSWGSWLLGTLIIYLNVRSGNFPDSWTIISTVLGLVGIAFGAVASYRHEASLLTMLFTNLMGCAAYLIVMLNTRNING